MRTSSSKLAHAVRDPNGRAYNRTAHLQERRRMMQAWADYLDDLRADPAAFASNTGKVLTGSSALRRKGRLLGYRYFGVFVYADIVINLRKFGALLLLLVSFVAPAVACMAPNVEMTAEERLCCRMNSDCTQMDMSASHGCCDQVLGTLHDSALRSEYLSLHPVFAFAIWVASFDLFPPHDAMSGWFQRPEHSPPKPLPSIIFSFRV